MSEQEFLKKLSATYNTPIVPPVVAPKVKSTNNAGMANASTPSKVQKPTADQLKEELRQLPFAAREALRKNAFTDQQGMINLPSTEIPEMAKFAGLRIPVSEWEQNYSSLYGGSELRAPTEYEKTAAPIDKGTVDATLRTLERDTIFSNAVQARGETDYFQMLKNKAPVEDVYDTSNPLDYILRLGDVGLRAGIRGTKDFIASSAGTIEAGLSFLPENPYSRYAMEAAQKMQANLAAWSTTTQDDKQLSSMRSIMQGGASDPAFYVDAIASTIPHMIGSLGAGVIGGGGKVATWLQRFAFAGAVEGGSMYTDMLDDGYNMDDARTAAALYGPISGSLDMIVPGKIAGKILGKNANKIIAESAKRTLAKEILRGGVDFAKDVTTEAFTEGLQQLSQNVVKSFYDKSQDWWEFVPDALVGGAAGGAFFNVVGNTFKGEAGDTDMEGVNMVRPPVKEGPQAGEPPATTPPAGPVGTEQAGPTMGAEPDTTAGNLEQQINDLFEAARAEEAAVQIGQKVLEQDGPNAVIEEAVQDARTALAEYNNQAKMVLEQYARNSAQPVIANDNVQVSLGTIPDGRFVASGTITIGNRGYDVPFDVKNAQATQGEAIASVVGDLTGWMTETLSTEGIIDDAAVANVVETLSNADQLYSNMDSFVYANQDAVLAAQDAASVEDFQATMTEQDISINENMDLNQFFKKATSADAVYLTKAAAKQVAQDLAGDLGVDVKFVDEIATNKRALGRFVQQVYGGQIQSGGTIEMRAEGDRTQDGDAVIRMSTPYHEAAHAYFRNLLLPEEQKAILDELRAEKKKEGLSDEAAEEILVEDLKNTVFKKKKRETRYGKILARLIEMTERALKWLGVDPMSKVERFYEDVLSKKRPSERKAAEIARRKQGLQDVREEYFQEPTRLTSKYLKFKEIAGKEFVSFQQAMNAVKGAGLKQAEADIITAVLETQFKDQKKISVAALQDAIVGELLPLEVKDSMKYADYGLGNVQMSGWDATTHIYDGPVEHGISGHFGGETTKLFGHTRIVQKGKVRAITEVQSDFFQKTRGDDLRIPSVSSVNKALEIIEKYKGLTLSEAKADLHSGLRSNSAVMNALWTDSPNGSAEYMLYNILKASDASGWYKNAVQVLKQQIPIAKGIDEMKIYANIWHERMIKEEIRLAAMDGVKTLRIVTPRTLAFIEQYVGTGDDIPYTYDDESGDVLQVGDVISMDGYDYYVFESDESSIVVVGKESGTTVPRTKDSYEMDFEGTTYYFPRERSETLSQPIAYKSGAGFSVDDLPEVQRNTYDFYKNKVNPYFKKLRKDNVREVTDENGFTWLETDITKQDAQAVEAFQTEEPIMYRGGKIQSIGELDLTASAELVRQGVLDLGSVFAEGPGYYFSSDKEDANRYGDIVLKVKGKEGARILTKNDKLTQREVSRILDSIDQEILEGAASNWSQSLTEGRQALIREIMSGDSALDQLMSVWADIYYWQNPDQFLDVMQKNGIDGIRVDKPGGIQHTVMYNKEALIELAGEVEAFQDFDEVELPAKKGMDPMKVVGYKMFPADEATRYVGVAKAVTEDTRRVKSADEQELMRIARTVETAYKYEEYLLRTYGIGYEDLVTNMVQELAAEVEMRLSVAAEFSTAGEGSGMLSLAQTAEVARTVAKKLGVLSRAYKKVTTRKVSAGDFGDIFDMHSTLLSYTTRTPSPDPVVIEAVQILGNAMDRIEELADPDRRGDGDMRGAIEQVNAMIRRSIDSNGRVRFSTFTGEVDNAYTAMNKMSKQYDATVRLRAQLQQMRTRRIEKEEVALRTKMERNTKRRIHQNIMKNGEVEPTITMNQREFYGAQAKTAEEVAKATKKEMREQYKLATQRKDLMEKIKTTKTKMQKRIREGRFVDVQYGKILLEFFDSFQNSQPSQKTIDKMIELEELRTRNAAAGIGTTDINGHTWSAEDQKAAEEMLAAYKKRMTQKALSTMTNEELVELYREMDTIIESGRIALQLRRYMNETEREKEIQRVVAGTVEMTEGRITEMMGKIGGDSGEGIVINTKQNIQKFLTGQAVADLFDGGQYGQGPNSKLLATIAEAEARARAQEIVIREELEDAKVALGFPKLPTKKEQAYLTLLVRVYEGEQGEFVAKRIADTYFEGQIPKKVGRITYAMGQSMVEAMADIRDKHRITVRQKAEYEMRTNKIFPSFDRYIMSSKFTEKTTPKDWATANEAGVADQFQSFGRNGTGVSDTFSIKRQANNTNLDPRIDGFNLFMDTIQHSLWYIEVQPAIDNVNQIVGSDKYHYKGGKVASTWWKEQLAIIAQKGSWQGADSFALLDILRQNNILAVLGGKLSTILTQTMQPFQNAMVVLPELGVTGAAEVMKESLVSLLPGYVKQAGEEVDNIMIRAGSAGGYDSADIQRRMKRDTQTILGLLGQAQMFLGNLVMQPMQIADAKFYAASYKAIQSVLLKQGVSEEEANKKASYLAELANASALTTYKPQIFSKGSTARLLLTLQSFQIAWFSFLVMAAGRIRSGSLRQKAYSSIALVGAPVLASVGMSIIGMLLRGEEWEDESLLMRWLKEVGYAVPAIGGPVRSVIEFGQVSPINSLAASNVVKMIKNTIDANTLSSESARTKAAIRASEAFLSNIGVPMTAQIYDWVAPLIEPPEDKANKLYKEVGKQLSFSSFSDNDVDRAVESAIGRAYGDTLPEMTTSQKTAARKKVIKAAAQADSNKFVGLIAKATKNDDKARVLIEAKGAMEYGEFDRMVDRLQEVGLLSEEGYKKYLELQYK